MFFSSEFMVDTITYMWISYDILCYFLFPNIETTQLKSMFSINLKPLSSNQYSLETAPLKSFAIYSHALDPQFNEMSHVIYA